MAAKVKAVPDGFRTVTPSMIVRDAAKAIEFYKKAFGAEEVLRMTMPDGKSIMHAEIKIGDSLIMVSEESKEWGCLSPMTLNGTPVSIHLYVEDVEAVFKRAVGAGATATMPLEDQFWGDRFGKLTDPFGHSWSLATHIEDVDPQECHRRSIEFFAKCQAGASA